MPKRGGNRGGGRPWIQNNDNQKFREKNYYDDHDDRGDKRNTIRKVSFKPLFKGRQNRNVADMAIKAHFDDADMGGGEGYSNSNDGYKSFRGRGNRQMRRNSPPPRSANGRKKLLPGVTGWFLVIIPHGQKYEKEYILKSLCDSISPEIFIPHYYKVGPTSVSFYVDDFKMAESLYNADRKIQTPDGFRLLVIVKNGLPTVQVDDTLKERMKLAMVKRYNATTKALDLSKFHSDPDLQDIFCALFRPTIMLLAINVISENIPDLEALNLSDNKIHLLDHLKCLKTKIPNLKILHLANNKIGTVTSLDALKGLPIVDLVLDGNPIKDRIKEETAYISEVRKRLPKVIKLDGMDLPPPIGFDIAENIAMPSPKASFLCDLAGADIVRQFLEQYFIIFDSDNRQPLLDAYHEHASFSLTATYNNTNRLSSYLPHNRNILRARDLELKLRHLKMGRLPVVSFLSELPATQHDPQSFGVDLTLFSPQLILLTVTGIFKEKTSSNNNNNDNNMLRSFQRSLVIVPAGGGFCIKNEMLHINNVTIAQERTAFKVLPINNVQNQQQQIQSNVVAPAPSTSALDEGTKMQMIQAMSQQSSMNLEWSKKCLEETSWDFQRAGHIFTELHKQNKIPPEAFIKY